MRRSRLLKRVIPITSVAVVLGLAFVLFTAIPARVQESAVSENEAGAAVAAGVPASSKIIAVAPATLRTLEAMQQAEASGARAPASDEGIRFRPTMGDAAYMAAKAAAASAPASTKSLPQGAAAPLAPPILRGINVNGASQAGLVPPDTHGAAGLDHFVEVTNSQRTVLSKATGAILSNVSLASFTGYFAQTLFDPRVVYDRVWNRWIIVVEARPESATVQRLFIAVSTTSNPLGSYFIYNIDVNIFNNDDFFDYPQVGMDQDSIIITANIFGPTTARGARLFAIAKARLYNGLGFSVPVFLNLPQTLAPPIVGGDQNATAFIANAPGNTNIVRLFALNNGSNAFQASLVARPNVVVPTYFVPPDAPQPSPCTAASHRLDTLDTRFNNACSQVTVGGVVSLFCAHTVALGSFAAVRWYEFNAANSTVIRSDTVFKSATSHDFNPSIAANDSRDMVVNWSATDPPFGAAGNPSVRFGGRRSFDATDIGVGTNLFTSPACLTGNFDPRFGVQRWGDYSATTVDPRNALRFWIVNEKVNSTSAWGSRVGLVGF